MADQTELLARLTSKLITHHPLPRSSGQGDVLRTLQGLLASAGVAGQLFTYTDWDIRHLPDYVDVASFGAEFGGYGECVREALIVDLRFPGSGPTVLLNGHVDVEFVGDPQDWSSVDGWRSGSIHAGRVWGRGATDMLGGVASMTVSLLEVYQRAASLGGRLIAQYVVDEEIGGNGTVYAASLLDETPSFAIVCEPTGNQVATVTRSFNQLSIRCHGQPRHMCTSTTTDNAIWQAANVLQAVEETNRWCQEALGNPGGRYLCVGRLEGGTDAAIPAATTDLLLTIAVPPALLLSDVRAMLHRNISRCLPDLPRPPDIGAYGLNFSGSVCSETTIAGWLAATAQAYGVTPRSSEFPSACDARILASSGIPTVVFGPGDLRAAHSVDESVAISDLVTHSTILTETLLRVFTTGDPYAGH